MQKQRFVRSRGCLLALVFGMVWTVVGCDEDNPTEPQDPTLDVVQAEVFTPSCGLTGCHAGADAVAGLDLSAGSAYERTVDVPSGQVPDLMRVEPGNPADSYLLIKILGGDRMAPGTFQMPIGTELSEHQVSLVEDWIQAGAER